MEMRNYKESDKFKKVVFGLSALLLAYFVREIFFDGALYSPNIINFIIIVIFNYSIIEFVFRDELPEDKKKRFRGHKTLRVLFLVGMIVYSITYFLLYFSVGFDAALIPKPYVILMLLFSIRIVQNGAKT